jgi:hypothetical protein
MNRPQLQRLARLTALLLLLGLAACGGRQRPIRPIIPTPDPAQGGALFYGQPIVVSFTNLNDDAAANLAATQFRNQLLEVTGAFVRTDPLLCGGEPFNGPRTTWALIAENLRLEIAGLGDVIELVGEGTTMTVRGYWRVYQGPVGCGKEPPAGLRFYLEAQQIVSPNPLPLGGNSQAGGSGIPNVGGVPEDAGPGFDGGPLQTTPEVGTTPGVNALSPTPGIGGTSTFTATPFSFGASPTPSRTPTRPAPTVTATSAAGATPTPTATGTPPNTPPPGSSPTPSATSTPLGQATPGPTSTSGPYPLPSPSNTPSPTPGY